MALKCISKPVWLRPPSLHYHALQVHLLTHTIMAYKLARSKPPYMSGIFFDHGLRVHLPTHSITASKFTWSCHLSAYLHTYSIMASKCITLLPPFQPPSSHNDALQVLSQAHLIVMSECISKFTGSSPASVSPEMLDYHHHHVHLQIPSITAPGSISEFTLSSV